MKRKRLALLLAVAMTITSIDSTAMAVSAAEFTADPVVEEAESETEAETTENPETEEMSVPSAEETLEDTADIELSDGDAVETEETTDSPEIVEEADSEETAEEAEFTSEEISADVVADGENTESIVPDVTHSLEINQSIQVTLSNYGDEAWFSFTPSENGVYNFYSTGGWDTEGYFFDSRDYTESLRSYRSTEHYDDQSGIENNFKLRKTLTAGITYYYCAKLYYEEETGSFDVTLTKEKSVVPDEVQTIDVDEIHTVNIENSNDCTWFSFTPSETGTYSFAAISDDEYYYSGTVGYFFDSRDYTGSLDSYRWSDHYNGGGGNFKLQRKLEAGKTYYYCAKCYDENGTGSFKVKLVRNKTLQKIQATLKNDKIAAGVSYGLSADVQYTFTDGAVETATLKLESWNSNTTEINAELTDVKIKKADDPDEYTYSRGDALAAGNYKVTFSLDDVTSNELEFQAVDIDELSGTLQEGENPDTRSPEYEYAYYKFTPSETGIYIFKNWANMGKYVKDEDGYLSSFSDENQMQKGTTYYIKLWGSWKDEEGDEYYNLNIQRYHSITGLSFTPDKTEICDSSSFIKDAGKLKGKLEITYDDGNTIIQENADCTTFYTDNYENQIRTVIKNEDGEVVDGNWLEVGTYTAYLKVDVESEPEITSDTFDFKVRKATADDCPQLTVGTNKVTDGIWYAFKPETTGLYDITCSGIAAENGHLNDEGEIDYTRDVADYDYNGFDLKKGKSFLVRFYKYDDTKETEFDCTITKIEPPVKLTVTSRIPSDEVPTFVEGRDNVYINEVEAEVLYEDGSKKYVSEFDDDKYNRCLHCELMQKDEDGNYSKVDNWGIPAGDYVYRVWYGRISGDVVYAEDIPVKVISMAEVAEAELSTGTQKLENKNGRTFLKFHPSEAGRYEISFNVPVLDVRVYQAEDNRRISAERKDYAAYATLEKDTGYYIEVQADKKYKELRMTTSLLTRPQSLKSKAHKTTYMAGVEDFDASTIETEITYPDKTTRKVRNQEETNGYYLQYRAVKDDSVAYNGSSLTSGTWKVEPYLSASAATGSAVALNIDAQGTEITAEKPDLSKYPAIKENAETTVKKAGITIYAFHADQDGTYVFNKENGSTWGTVWFYREGKDALECTYESIELKEGETCAVIVKRTAGEPESKFTVKKQAKEDSGTGETETPITDTTLELKTGMKSLVKIESDKMECTFTPEETGCYVIWSEFNKNEDCLDPRVTLIEDIGNNEYNLYDDDDGGTGMNFRLIHKLEQGRKYQYDVDARGSSESFYLGFAKIELKKIRKIESQPKEGKDAANFSVLDSFWEYFNMKITYEDSSSEILEWNSGRDSYANEIEVGISTDGKTTDEEQTLKVKFSTCNRLLEQDEYQIISEESVKCKGLSGFAQITAGTAQSLSDSTEDYKHGRFAFQAPEDGEYIVQIDGAVEERATATIFHCWEAGDYDEGLSLSTMTRREEADGTYSFQLKKDEWYLVDADALTTENQQPTVSIHKAKDISSLELVKAPEQTTILPNDVNAVSLKGMEVKVTYTDGSEETVAYGQTDSDGRYLQHNGVNWLNAEKCRVYVRLGRYQVSFDAVAGSWDDVKELEFNKATKLTAIKGDMITLKLNAVANDIYVFDNDGCYVKDVTEAETGKVTEVFGDQIELQKDTLYYVHVHAFRENPTIKAKQGVCVWKETSRKEATCTADGFITETCSVHGEVRTEIIPKLGHDLGNRQTVKAATCGAAGESARICSRCKGKFEKQTIKATGKHKYGSWKTKKESTALTEGQKERICTVCKKAKQTQKIAKLKATLKLSVAAKKTLSLKLKRSYKVSVQMTKGDRVVSWKSSNPKAVTVDKYGKITGKQAGKTAKITVKLKSGLTTWFNVKVQKTDVATTSLKLKNASTGKYMANSVTLKRKQILKVTPVIAPVTSTQKVTYTTSNEKVATVASNGQITAKRKGTAYITAKSGRKSVKIKVTVK